MLAKIDLNGTNIASAALCASLYRPTFAGSSFSPFIRPTEKREDERGAMMRIIFAARDYYVCYTAEEAMEGKEGGGMLSENALLYLSPLGT